MPLLLLRACLSVPPPPLPPPPPIFLLFPLRPCSSFISFLSRSPSSKGQNGSLLTRSSLSPLRRRRRRNSAAEVSPQRGGGKGNKKRRRREMLMMSRVPRISALYNNRGRVLSKGRRQIWVQNLLPLPLFLRPETRKKS